jgi:hypothetical protein
MGGGDTSGGHAHSHGGLIQLPFLLHMGLEIPARGK